MEYDISVIIPVYNEQLHLNECVESIISSKVFPTTEVILVDDGSVDGSAEICDSYSGKYENIITFHISNGGVSNARNTGLDNCHGEYVTFCDSDDYYVSDILSDAFDVITKDKPDLVFYDFVYEQEHSCDIVSFPFYKNVILNSSYLRADVPEFMLKNHSFNSSCNKFFKNVIINENNIRFKKGQKHGEDRDFVLQFLLNCNSGYYLAKEGYFYRYVKQSAVNKSRTDYFCNIYNDYATKTELYKDFKIPSEKVADLSEASAAQGIVSCTFSAEKSCSFSGFSKSLDTLYKNETLMKILSDYYNKGLFSDESYKKIAELLLKQNTVYVFAFIKGLKLKESLYRLIYQRGL